MSADATEQPVTTAETATQETPAPVVDLAAALEAAKAALPERPKMVQRVDEEAYTRIFEDLTSQIDAIHVELKEIKAKLEKTSGAGDGLEVEKKKELAALKIIRDQIRDKQTERRTIAAELENANKGREQKRAQAKRILDDLPRGLHTIDRINARVEEMENRIQTSSLSPKEEKQLLLEINNLKRSKADVRRAEELTAEANGDTGGGSIRDRLKAKEAELRELKHTEEGMSANMDSLIARMKGDRGNNSGLYQRRNHLKKQLDELYDQRAAQRKELNGKKREFSKYEYDVRHYKRMLWNLRRAEDAVAGKENKDKEPAPEAADEPVSDIIPWAEERARINALREYLRRMLPKEAAAAPAAPAAEIKLDGMKRVVRKDEEFYTGSKKSAKAKAKAEPRVLPLRHSAQAFDDFASVGIEVPITTEQIPATLEALAAKDEEYKNRAPPTREELKKSKKTAYYDDISTNQGSAAAQESAAAAPAEGAAAAEADDGHKGGKGKGGKGKGKKAAAGAPPVFSVSTDPTPAELRAMNARNEE